MINLVERRLVTIKPQEAAKMIDEHNEYQGQRPLRQSHVDFLAKKMENNRFQEAQIAFARLPDGTSTILNGQHSLLCGAPHNKDYADFRIMRTSSGFPQKAAA